MRHEIQVASNYKYGSSPSEWRLVMRLLGLMTVANGRFTPDDMKAFQEQTMILRAVIDPSLVMTRKMAKDWLVNNKGNISSMITDLETDSELLAIFKQFRNYKHKHDVITAMVQVGIADGDYGNVEKMLIKKTILYWNIRGGDNEADHQEEFAKKTLADA